MRWVRGRTSAYLQIKANAICERVGDRHRHRPFVGHIQDQCVCEGGRKKRRTRSVKRSAGDKEPLTVSTTWRILEQPLTVSTTRSALQLAPKGAPQGEHHKERLTISKTSACWRPRIGFLLGPGGLHRLGGLHRGDSVNGDSLRSEGLHPGDSVHRIRQSRGRRNAFCSPHEGPDIRQVYAL